MQQEFEIIWSQFEEQRKKAKDPDALNEGKTDDQHKDEFRQIAERRIKLGLLLSEVGRANNVQIAQEDINKHLMTEARRHPGHEQEVLQRYKDNPEAMEKITAPIYEEKVVDFILGQATITEKQATLPELMKALEEDQDAKAGKKAKSPAKPKTKAKGKAKSREDKKTAQKPAQKTAKKKDK